MDKLQDLILSYLKTKNQNILVKIIKQLDPLLINRSIKISKLTGLAVEDIKQELIIVLIQRLQKYDIIKSKFITYIYNSLRGDPTHSLQAMVRKKRGGDGKHKYITFVSLDSEFKEDGMVTKLIDKVVAKNHIKSDLDLEDASQLIEKYGKTKAKRILMREWK